MFFLYPRETKPQKVKKNVIQPHFEVNFSSSTYYIMFIQKCYTIINFVQIFLFSGIKKCYNE